MNEGIHLDLDTWIVPGQIRKANLCRGLGNRYKPAGTEVLISAVIINSSLENTVSELSRSRSSREQQSPSSLETSVLLPEATIFPLSQVVYNNKINNERHSP